jgi:ElaB/YqjD/DUF883 family membrane-anchored ribosome-binding protein
MNEQEFGTKMEKDGTRVKKAINTMVGDGVSQLKGEFDEFSGTVKSNANEAASSMRKDVNRGMKQYNSKAQEVVDRLPFDISQNVRKYPWVVISLSLIFGFTLGILLKPSHQ